MEKILVVEDAPTQAKRTQLILQSQGYQVMLAGNGLEGVKKAGDEKPDLIISDINMPEIDGYQMCSMLKNNKETENIPVIILTSKNEVIDIIKGLEVGADNFITKPFDSRCLIERVSKIIENVRLKKEGLLRETTDEFDEKIAITANRQQILQLILSTLSVNINCELIGLLLLEDKYPFYIVSFQPISAKTQQNFMEKFVISLNDLGFKDFDCGKMTTFTSVIDSQLPENQSLYELYDVNVPLYMKEKLIGLLGAGSSMPLSIGVEDIKTLHQIGIKSINAFNRSQS